MTPPDPRTTILVLHQATLDPKPYLGRLIGQSASSSSSNRCTNDEDHRVDSGECSTRIPWTIDNKYYSASVTLQCYAQEGFEQTLAEDIEVVLYLFAGQVVSLPPALVRLMAAPRDIALAVRIPPSVDDEAPRAGTGLHDDPQAQQPSSGDELGQEALEDMFDELGMEFLDEAAPIDEEADERPVPILEQVRQTLMTHMWPNMVRKLLASSGGIDEDPSPSRSASSSPVAVDRAGSHNPISPFPISFHSSGAVHQADPGPSTIPPLSKVSNDIETEFPGVDELKSQIMLADTERLGDLNRLDMLDQDDDWVQAEYSRLDDWLDGDDEVQDNRLERADPLDPSGTEPELGASNQSQGQDGVDSADHENELGDASQFEDDFADFAPFQSAPPASSYSNANLALDPTPLLLHLQNVREELAGLDEDSRRQRAGKEVETVLRSLGLGGLDWEEDDFADLDEPSK